MSCLSGGVQPARGTAHYCIGGFRKNWSAEAKKGKRWTPVYEAIDPDDVDPRAYVGALPVKYVIRHTGRRPGQPAQWWNSAEGWVRNKKKATRYLTKKEADQHAKDDIWPKIPGLKEQYIRIDPVVEAIDPDDIDPRSYAHKAYDSPILGYKVTKREGVEAWTVSSIRSLAGQASEIPVGIIFYDPQDDVPPNANPAWHYLHWIAYPNIGDGQAFQSFDEAVRFLARKYEVRGFGEALDPDAIDPHEFLKSVFPHKAKLKDVVWAMDAAGIRGIGVYREDGDWRIYGLAWGTQARSERLLLKLLKHFDLTPKNLVWTWEWLEHDNMELNRQFQMILPVHVLSYDADASYPLDSHIRAESQR